MPDSSRDGLPDLGVDTLSIDGEGTGHPDLAPFDGGGGHAEVAPIDAGAGPLDGGREASTMEVDWCDAGTKADLYVPTPTDEQSCVQAINVLPCDAGGTTMLIRAATPGTFFLKAEVIDGLCGVAGAPICYGGCDSLTIFQGIGQTLGSTCDLLVTFLGGGEKSVHLELVANPSPTYMCCGAAVAPNTGRWIALDPLRFSPPQVLLSSPIDGGVGDAERFFDAPMVLDTRPPSEKM